MTINITSKYLQVSFQSSLKELPFSKGFSKRFDEVVRCLENYLRKDRLNGFSASYNVKPFYSFNVSLCGDKKMRTLNHQFRHKDKTTDVLTLALYEDIRAGQEFLFEEVELGDIFISAPVMKRQANEYNVTVENEFFHLMIHGFLHLLGFDHEISPEEEILMEAHEKKLIESIHKKIKV